MNAAGVLAPVAFSGSVGAAARDVFAQAAAAGFAQSDDAAIFNCRATAQGLSGKPKMPR
jgi:hypothetical protein